jgi:hypothetical protein
LLAPSLAQYTNVVRVAGFLDEHEIAEIRAVAVRQRIERKRGGSIVYMQEGGFWQQEAPVLHQKLCNLVIEVDHKHWGILADMKKSIGKQIMARCVEYHEYSQGRGRMMCGNHFDTGSLFTIDCMLSHCSEHGGGSFVTTTDEQAWRQDFEQGDAIVFLSHKYHAVAPVPSGLRNVLVTEFWDGCECKAAHRCCDGNVGCD